MKFPVYFAKNNTLLKIFLYAVTAVSLFLLVMSIITLFDVYTFMNLSFGQAKVLIVTTVLAIFITLALATIHYKIDDTHLRLQLLFFDILGGRIRIENILNIVYSNGAMYISYLWKGNDPVIAEIMIAPKKFDKMKETLMSKNQGIVFYEDKDQATNSKQQ